MIVSATRAQAKATRRRYTSPHGARADVETYFGQNKALLGDAAPATLQPGAAMPNAYLVCQQADAQLHPHFHQADQFQVIVGGSGRIGTHAVSAVTVHYAAAHSPYGPVVAGPQALEYLTLRRQWDPGAQWMPEHADDLRAMPDRRHLVLTSQPLPAQAAQQPRGAARAEVLLQDGPVQALAVTLGPHAQWHAGRAADLFAYVLQGAPVVQGAALDPQACLFAGEADGPLSIATGPQGARVLLTLFAPTGASHR